MRITVVFLAILISLGTVLAQTKDPAEVVSEIQLQLIDLSAKEEATKLQLQQLDEALKPENIANSVAGYGSTRPEELREQRRRELTIAKTNATAQLDQLAQQRVRLEANLATAQVEAYHQSAKGVVPMENYFGFSVKRSTRVAMSIVFVLLLLTGALAIMIVKLRLKSNSLSPKAQRD